MLFCNLSLPVSELSHQQGLSSHRTAAGWMFVLHTIQHELEKLSPQLLKHSNQLIWKKKPPYG